jgi:hypothetical protein
VMRGRVQVDPRRWTAVAVLGPPPELGVAMPLLHAVRRRTDACA